METLILIDQGPYGNWAGREALDMAFSLAAFDQPVTLLFTGTGVNWLRLGQQAAAIDQKSVENNLSAAPVFGITALLADRNACARYGLQEEGLMSGARLVDCGPALFNHYHHIVCP